MRHLLNSALSLVIALVAPLATSLASSPAEASSFSIERCLEQNHQLPFSVVQGDVTYVNYCLWDGIVKYFGNHPKSRAVGLLTAQRESNFDPAARGAAGEIGLMQVLPQTAALVGVEQLLTIDDVIKSSFRYHQLNFQRIRQHCSHIREETPEFYQQLFISYNGGGRWARNCRADAPPSGAKTYSKELILESLTRTFVRLTPSIYRRISPADSSG